MRLIVGLWNPGKQYELTRHNAGFLAIDALHSALECWAWQWEKSFKAEISKGVFDGQSLLLIKPQTYMNLSGDAVAAALNFYKIDPSIDMLVISDDIDQAFGKLRMRIGGSSGGQNGLKNIIERIGSDQFARLKIGIGRDENFTVADWVLSRLTLDERARLEDEILPLVIDRVRWWLQAV